MLKFWTGMIASAILLLTNSAKPEVSLSDFSGEWKSGALSAVVTTGKDKECRSMMLIERTLRLERIPGNTQKLRGQWGRETSYIWLSSNGGRCRWGIENSFVPVQSALMLFSITGSLESTSNKLAVDGTYEDCNGNGCAIWLNDQIKKPFHTDLVYDAGSIFDADPMVKGLVRFIRTGEVSERLEAARLAADRALSFVDKGNYDGFFQEAWKDSSVTGAEQQNFKEGFASARNMRGEVISRIPVREVYAECWSNSLTLGDYALVIRDAKTSKNAAGREVVMMGKQNGIWRVMWFDYLS